MLLLATVVFIIGQFGGAGGKGDGTTGGKEVSSAEVAVRVGQAGGQAHATGALALDIDVDGGGEPHEEEVRVVEGVGVDDNVENAEAGQGMLEQMVGGLEASA